MRATALHAVGPTVAAFYISPLAKLITACCVRKPKPKLSRARWGEIELCREALRMHDFNAAKEKYELLLEKARRRQDLRLQARVLNDLAYLHRIIGEVHRADELYKDAYRIWKSLQLTIYSPSLTDYMHCLLDYAAFLRTVGRHADAVQLEGQVGKISARAQTPYFVFSRAELLETRGQEQEAERAYEQCLVDAALKNDLDLQLRVFDKMVPLYRRLGQQDMTEAMERRRRRLQVIRGEHLFAKRSLQMQDRDPRSMQSMTWILVRTVPTHVVDELAIIRMKQMDSRFMACRRKAG